MSQNDTENDKNPKVFLFSKISCIFSKLSTDFVNWKIEKGQQRENVLSNMLRKEVNAVFQTKIVRIRHRNDKISKIFRFLIFFVDFLSKYRRLRRGLEC